MKGEMSKMRACTLNLKSSENCSRRYLEETTKKGQI